MEIFDIPECDKCDGPNEVLGTLGNLTHLRCRNCGWDSSIHLSEPDAIIEDDDNDYAFEDIDIRDGFGHSLTGQLPC